MSDKVRNFFNRCEHPRIIKNLKERETISFSICRGPFYYCFSSDTSRLTEPLPYPSTSLHHFPFVCDKDKKNLTGRKIKLYVIQHILHFYWCHFCQSRTRRGGIGLDVTPDLLPHKREQLYK
jgi:hypothetical protein